MRIVIPSIQVPFIAGGAELMTSGLAAALERHGHQVEVVTFPFKFAPDEYLLQLSDFCQTSDFSEFNGMIVDRIIALQFPAYFVRHPNKVLWLMHQHRAFYDLFEDQVKNTRMLDIRNKIVSRDTEQLSHIVPRLSMSKNVSARLLKYNGIESSPLYHPPPDHEKYFYENSENFIFCPSRLERLKRQDLLISAIERCKSPVGVIFAGEGGQSQYYRALVESLGVEHKVRFLGQVTQREKILYYSRALAVFFGPFDEDYGYVTLEAMLSEKPVITCTDSGGTLEFVDDGISGFAVPPDPDLIAEKIDYLYFNRRAAREMGAQARASYEAMNVSWDHVVSRLLEGEDA